MRKISMTLAALVALSACGNKRGGNAHKPLTTEQKRQLKQTVSDASAATRASGDINKSGRDTQRSRRLNGLATSDSVFAAPFSFATQQDETNYHAMADSMENCLVEEKSIVDGIKKSGVLAAMSPETASHAGGQPQEPDLSKLKGASFGYKVYGEQCPIKLGMNLSIPELDAVGGNIRRLVVTFGMEYAALTDSFKQLSDIDSFKFDGGLQAAVAQTTKATLEVGGKFHSQAKGDIGLKIAGLMQGTQDQVQSAQATMTMTFPDFVAELLVKSDGKSEPQYFLNGEKMTQEQVEQFFAEALDAGKTVGGGDDDQPQQPTPPQEEPAPVPTEPEPAPVMPDNVPEMPGFPVRN